jgi:hypothetical protein
VLSASGKTTINPSQYYSYFADDEDKLGAAEGRFIDLMLI